MAATPLALVGLLATATAGVAATIFQYGGIACATDPTTGMAACVRHDGTGFVAGMSRDVVAIRDAQRHFVFWKANTGGAAAKSPSGKRLFVYRGIECRTRKPAQVFCARTDNTGFAITISREAVSVTRLWDMKRVFFRAND